jgi:hypothetical protein
MGNKYSVEYPANEIIIYNKSSYHIDIYFYIGNRLIGNYLDINETTLYCFDYNFDKIEIYNKHSEPEINYRVFNITENNKIIYADGRHDSVIIINDKYTPWTLIYNIVPRIGLYLINYSNTDITIIDEVDEHIVLKPNNDIRLDKFKYIIAGHDKNSVLDIKRKCFNIYNNQAYIQNQYYSDNIIFECKDKKENVEIIAKKQYI